MRKSPAEQAHDHQMAILDSVTSRERQVARAKLRPAKPCYICGAKPDANGLISHDRTGHGRFSD